MDNSQNYENQENQQYLPQPVKETSELVTKQQVFVPENAHVYVTDFNNKEQTVLSPRQLTVIAHLIASSNISEACRTANVTDTTIDRWMQIPEFKAELDKQRKELIDHSLDKLKGAIGKAVDKLIELLNNKNASVARYAATSILEYAFRLRELDDISKKVEKIERIILERRISYGT